MGRILVTKDNQTHLVFSEEDFFRLVEARMGSDSSELLRDKFEEVRDDLDGYDETIKNLKVDHKDMVKSVDAVALWIRKLLDEENTDKNDIADALDEIADAIHADPWKWE